MRSCSRARAILLERRFLAGIADEALALGHAVARGLIDDLRPSAVSPASMSFGACVTRFGNDRRVGAIAIPQLQC